MEGEERDEWTLRIRWEVLKKKERWVACPRFPLLADILLLFQTPRFPRRLNAAGLLPSTSFKSFVRPMPARSPVKVGALLRREGLYSSYLVTWRQQRDRAAQASLVASKRGPKAKVVDPRVKQLERENANLKRRIRRMDLLIQKKASEILGIPLNHLDEDENE